MRDPLDLSDVPAANRRAFVLALGVVVRLVAVRQLVRRWWRSWWWRVAGIVNVRWRCDLCDARGPRAAQRFCRSCWDDGLGGGESCPLNVAAQRDFDRVQTAVVVVRFVVRAFVLCALVGGALYFSAWVVAFDLAMYGGNP